MRIAIERICTAVIGALMLWSAPHWAADGLALRRSGAPGGADCLVAAAAMVLLAGLFLDFGVRGRAPWWADRAVGLRKRGQGKPSR